MWNSQNNLDYFCTLSESKSGLLHDTVSKFRIPASGVVLVFDTSDYHKSSMYSDKSIWKNLGNHLNIKEGDGIDDQSPPKIKELIKSFDFSHMIWHFSIKGHLVFISYESNAAGHQCKRLPRKLGKANEMVKPPSLIKAPAFCILVHWIVIRTTDKKGYNETRE